MSGKLCIVFIGRHQLPLEEMGYVSASLTEVEQVRRTQVVVTGLQTKEQCQQLAQRMYSRNITVHVVVFTQAHSQQEVIDFAQASKGWKCTDISRLVGGMSTADIRNMLKGILEPYLVAS